MGECIVLGAGISGCAAGNALAEQGNRVTILESDSIIGGKVLDYCCKATDSCVRCGVCIAHTRLKSSLYNPHITFLTGSTVDTAAVQPERVTLQIEVKNPGIDYRLCSFCGKCVDACPEGAIELYRRGELVQYRIDYSKCRLHKGESCSLCSSACPEGAVRTGKPVVKRSVSGDRVILASGHSVFDAARKPRYAYGRSDKVFTGSEVEEMLSNRSYIGKADEDVAFIQCVGSRDPEIGRNYCSAVCCSYAVRMARMLKYRNPEARVTVYYIDIQNFDKEYTLLRRETEELGVRFVRGVPFRIEESADGRLRMLIENQDGDATLVHHDYAVLSVGMGPAEEGMEVAGKLGIHLDENGFADSRVGPIRVCGTCGEPQSIVDSIESAGALALEIGKEINERK